MSSFIDVKVDFRDGTTETFTYVSIIEVNDAFLELYVINNTYTKEREHLGSWPLDTIKKWTKRAR